MNTRALVLCGIVATSLLVCTPAAFASPRSDHIHRHHTLTSWADDRGDRGVHNRDDVWRFYSSRDGSEDDSDSSDSGSDGADESDTGDSTTDTTSDSAVAETGTQAVAGGTGAVLTGTQKTVTASLTGYSRADNNPPGSAQICCGVIHKEASGTGTAADPITAASAGSGAGIEVKAGTVVYVGKLRKYFIIEDSGATATGKFRMDLWVDGKGFPDSAAERCMSTVTGDAQVIVNPPKNLPVGKIGPLTGPNGCNI